MDTDKDGLSDYDELNIYKTSPYIEDSDSDGYTDGEEVKNDKDPNCPSGQDCGGGGVTTPINPSLEENGSQDTAPEEKKSTADIDSIKKFLLSNGMDKEVLDQASDEDIISTYEEIFGQ